MVYEESNRKTTTSFRLNRGLHRAARDVDEPIGTLAEEGVVHGVAERLIGLCWLCGSYIGKRTGAERMDRGRMASIAQDGVFEHPGEWEPDTPDDGSVDEKLSCIAGRMLLPEETVEVCSDCFTLIEEIEYTSPREFPVAYYFRSIPPFKRPKADFNRISIAYAAEVTAVTWATPADLYEEGRKESAFWWAVHPPVRHKIGAAHSEPDPPWQYIARYSNAFCWGSDRQAIPVFAEAGDKIGDNPQLPKIGRTTQYWPGKIPNRSPSGTCPACFSGYFTGDSCSDCFYTKEVCDNCSGTLRISIDGQVERTCDNCSWTDFDPYFEEDFVEVYSDVFADIRRYTPQRRRGDVNRIISAGGN